jgi:hypothetical protein
MPYLGQTVVFIPRPGSARAGQSEMAAIVTRVLSDNHVCLLALPDDPNCDMWARDRVPMQGPDNLHNCWKPTEGETALAELRQMLEDLTAPAPAADDGLDQLRAAAEAAGIKIDRRWGAERLRQEIDRQRAGEAV